MRALGISTFFQLFNGTVRSTFRPNRPKRHLTFRPMSKIGSRLKLRPVSVRVKTRAILGRFVPKISLWDVSAYRPSNSMRTMASVRTSRPICALHFGTFRPIGRNGTGRNVFGRNVTKPRRLCMQSFLKIYI